jgi:hypothetical protein
MKKSMAKILSAILLFGLCFGLVGCKDKEDCIPEKLGQAEGLYLYYNNYRSLTDGTQTETLVSEITVDGVTYTDEEFEIDSLVYATASKEIVYSIAYPQEEEKAYCIWHYNYDTKESGLVMKSKTFANMQASDSYVCITFGYAYTPKVVLLDMDLNVVEDSFVGMYTFKDDYIYKQPYYNVGKFEWWKDGNFYEIQTPKKQIYSSCTYTTGDYAYLFFDNVLYLIDLNTGEYKTHTFPQNEVLKEWHGFCQIGDKVYCITTSQITQTNLEHFPLETGCKLYCMQGLNISPVYTFDEEYQMEFSGNNERYLNFDIERFKTYLLKESKTEKFHGYYDLQENKFVKGKTKQTEKGNQNFKIGEYEFYTDNVKYGPLMGNYRCYYLHRITNGKDEILQYHFDESNGEGINPVLFEDIYTI